MERMLLKVKNIRINMNHFAVCSIQIFRRQNLSKSILKKSFIFDILSLVTVVGVSHKHILEGVNDLSFEDLEDSFQYQSALQAKCDTLITINLRDYRLADLSTIEILSPTEFVNRYL